MSKPFYALRYRYKCGKSCHETNQSLRSRRRYYVASKLGDTVEVPEELL